MSKAFFYKCDGCGKAVGDKPHITLQFLGGSGIGIALPPGHKNGRSNGWHTKQGIQGQIYQFHNCECTKLFFDRHLKEAIV